MYVNRPEGIAELGLRMPALDGFLLGATLYSSSSAQNPSTVVLIACGGGIPAARYAWFARFLATHSVPALLFDYRGIGASRVSSLRGFKAVAEDWSELDCGGAIKYLRDHYPSAEIVAVAHSIGTMLIGGAPNVNSISRFVFLCAHTGYYADYMSKYRLPMAILWHGLMPAVTPLFGYFPASLLGLGEDIPAGIAMQWAARRTPDFRPQATTRDSARANSMLARYKSVEGEVLKIGFTDDAFATRVGGDRLMSAFPALRPLSIEIAPRQAGMSQIGHFGFFRREGATTLWPFVLGYICDGTSTFSPSAANPPA